MRTLFDVDSSFANSVKRTTSGIDELLKRYGWERDGMLYRGGEDKTIALFCHFGMGITVLSYLLGISPIVAQHNFFLALSNLFYIIFRRCCLYFFLKLQKSLAMSVLDLKLSNGQMKL